jgi:hypothetical protein
MSNVALERNGDLDRPSYIQGLSEDHHLRRNENTFAFSMALAAQELAHFIAILTGLMNLRDMGNQRFHTKQQWFLTEHGACQPECPFKGLTATVEQVLPRSAFLRIEADHST